MRTGSIKYSGLFVAGVVFIDLAGIAPVAQSGTMGNGADQRNGIAAGPQTQATKDNAIAIAMPRSAAVDEQPNVQGRDGSES